MRFSFNFIKEILDIDLDPKVLAQKLTMAGMEVEALEKVGDDWVFDIEITTNRYDWLSVIGVAREMAAVSGKTFKPALPAINKTPKLISKKVYIQDARDCPFYVARLIKGIKVSGSGARLRQRVNNSGIASISDVVDITNYCMLKWGNPLHAFDAARVEGDIRVRRAKNGEKFTGLDNKEYILDKENLVIADDKKVIALAGVMGAKNTEVTETTTDVLLEAAVFSPLTIRRSRRKAGLSTDSSYRFERRVSADCLEYACAQAAEMIAATTGTKDSAYLEAGKKPARPARAIGIDCDRLRHYLGAPVTNAQIKKIALSLGCRVAEQGKKLSVKPPAMRFDLEREVDIYEEVARLYGYDNIEPRLAFFARQYEPALTGVQKRITEKQNSVYYFRRRLSELLARQGFSEIVTFSLESSADLKKIGYQDQVLLANPLRSQEDALRPSLLLGAISALRHNLNNDQAGLNFFEIAAVYRRGNDYPQETTALSLSGDGEDAPLRIKAAIERLLASLDIAAIGFTAQSRPGFTNALNIFSGEKEIGFLGRLDSAPARERGIKSAVGFAQLDVALLQGLTRPKRYRASSAYPALWRDISVVLKGGVGFKTMEEIVRNKAGSILSGLKIIDRYRPGDLAAQDDAFTARLFYQSRERTLTAQEVEVLHEEIRRSLAATAGIILR